MCPFTPKFAHVNHIPIPEMNTFLTADLFGFISMSYMLGIGLDSAGGVQERQWADKRPSQVVLTGGCGAL